MPIKPIEIHCSANWNYVQMWCNEQTIYWIVACARCAYECTQYIYFHCALRSRHTTTNNNNNSYNQIELWIFVFDHVLNTNRAHIARTVQITPTTQNPFKIFKRAWWWSLTVLSSLYSVYLRFKLLTQCYVYFITHTHTHTNSIVCVYGYVSVHLFLFLWFFSSFIFETRLRRITLFSLVLSHSFFHYQSRARFRHYRRWLCECIFHCIVFWSCNRKYNENDCLFIYLFFRMAWLVPLQRKRKCKQWNAITQVTEEKKAQKI